MICLWWCCCSSTKGGLVICFACSCCFFQLCRCKFFQSVEVQKELESHFYTSVCFIFAVEKDCFVTFFHTFSIWADLSHWEPMREVVRDYISRCLCTLAGEIVIQIASDSRTVLEDHLLTYIVPGGECAKYGERYGARTHKLLKNDPSHLTCTVDVPCHAQHHRSLGKNSLPCYLL